MYSSVFLTFYINYLSNLNSLGCITILLCQGIVDWAERMNFCMSIIMHMLLA